MRTEGVYTYLCGGCEIFFAVVSRFSVVADFSEVLECPRCGSDTRVNGEGSISYRLYESKKVISEVEGDLVMDKVWWTMKDLEQVTGYSDEWLKEHILHRPTYKIILDLESGGFVYYPEKRGEKWLFIASRMKEFLEKYFVDIFNKQN